MLDTGTILLRKRSIYPISLGEKDIVKLAWCHYYSAKINGPRLRHVSRGANGLETRPNPPAPFRRTTCFPNRLERVRLPTSRLARIWRVERSVFIAWV